MPDFDFEDGGSAPDRRPRRRDAGHGDSAFKTMFGGSLGCAAAIGFLCLLVVGGTFLVCGGCVGLGILGRQSATSQQTGEPPPKVEPKKK